MRNSNQKMLPTPKVMDIAQIQTKVSSLENRLLEVESMCLELHKNNRDNRLYYQLKRIKDWVFHGTKAWLTFAPGSRPRRISKRILLACRNYVLFRPWLKSILLNPSIRLGYILRRVNLALMETNKITSLEKQSASPLRELTPRAQEIYAKLAAHFLGE